MSCFIWKFKIIKQPKTKCYSILWHYCMNPGVNQSSGCPWCHHSETRPVRAGKFFLCVDANTLFYALQTLLLLCLGVHPKSVRPLRLTVSITHSWLTVGQRSVLSGLLAAFCGIYRRCSSSWTHEKHVCKSGRIPRSFSRSFTAVSAVRAAEIKSIQNHWHKISLYVVNILHSLLPHCPHTHANTHALKSLQNGS